MVGAESININVDDTHKNSPLTIAERILLILSQIKSGEQGFDLYHKFKQVLLSLPRFLKG
jgi:hypothetical protein